MTRPAEVSDLGLRKGVWTLRLAGDDAPDLIVRYRGQLIDGLDCQRGDAGWDVRVPCPDDAISDGTHSLVLHDAATGRAIATTTIVAGRALDGDLVSEVALLRAELDLLKRAFRKHCAQAAED